MSLRVPKGIDELMWVLAEEADPAAIEEFGERFPEHRVELGKRLGMVRAFRGARTSRAQERIPRFRPPGPRVAPRLRFAWAAGSVALAALAFGSYVVARSAMGPAETAARAETQVPMIRANVGSENQAPQTQGGIDIKPPAKEVEGPESEAFELARVTIRAEHIRLSKLLERIATECGLELEIAPGMEDPEVVADFTDASGFDILHNLGPRFGFTAFRQSGNKVLIIPAVDAGSGTEDGADSRTNAVPGKKDASLKAEGSPEAAGNP